MSPEQQRIAIAQACGWTLATRQVFWRKDEVHWHSPALRGHYSKLPDYLNDLNAMHEAEKILTDEQRRAFAHIVRAHLRDAPFEQDWNFCCIHAAAAQRAEAFLRTLSLWKDEA